MDRIRSTPRLATLAALMASVLAALPAGAALATDAAADAAAPSHPPVFAPLYESAPRQIASSRIVHQDAEGVFLENLIVRSDGSALSTSFLDGRVLITGVDDTTRLFAQLPGAASGIAEAPDGHVLVVGWRAADEGRLVWVLDAKGAAVREIPLPGVALPNGFVALDPDAHPGLFLITDSARGRVWQLDLGTGALASWSDAPELGGFDPTIVPAIPAANGIRVHDGFAYVANMQRRLLVRLPIDASGRAGAAETVLEGVFIDDFAIDAGGRIHAATHPYDSVIRIDTDRRVTVVATFDQGLQGATSVALRKAANGRESLLVTTNGGVYVPPAYGTSVAKLVQVDLPR